MYRPPNLKFQDFIKDFLSHLPQNITSNTILLVDFNIHVNKTSLGSSIDIKDLLSNNDIKQHITFPTHICGNILDLIITRIYHSIASEFNQSILFSDHYAILFLIHTSKPLQIKKIIEYRKISSIDPDEFKNSFLDNINHQNDSPTIETMNKYLKFTLNKFAPLK